MLFLILNVIMLVLSFNITLFWFYVYEKMSFKKGWAIYVNRIAFAFSTDILTIDFIFNNFRENFVKVKYIYKSYENILQYGGIIVTKTPYNQYIFFFSKYKAFLFKIKYTELTD